MRGREIRALDTAIRGKPDAKRRNAQPYPQLPQSTLGDEIHTSDQPQNRPENHRSRRSGLLTPLYGQHHIANNSDANTHARKQQTNDDLVATLPQGKPLHASAFFSQRPSSLAQYWAETPSATSAFHWPRAWASASSS